MRSGAYRDLTAREKNLVENLVRPEFDGVSQIRKQLESCQARTIDAEGSFELNVKRFEKAVVRFRVPVELYGQDADGAGIHVLLHVVEGICKEIEIYKDTSTAIVQWPNSWDAMVSGPER